MKFAVLEADAGLAYGIQYLHPMFLAKIQLLPVDKARKFSAVFGTTSA